MRLLNHQQLKEWSKLRPWKNLGLLCLDYSGVAMVAALAVGFHLFRAGHGLHWAWEAPVWTLAVFFMGILQHRIALMGHEASHYLLLPSRAWNDRVANLLIFFPLYTTIGLYRKRHIGHHLHPNDHERDPNLSGGKAQRIWAKFPMSKEIFARRYYLLFFWPPFVLVNLMDLFQTLTMGAREAARAGAGRDWAMLLGQLCYCLMLAVVVVSSCMGLHCWPVLVCIYAVAVVVWACLPDRFFGGETGMVVELKWAGLLRLSFYAFMLLVVSVLDARFGGQVLVGVLVLWICPLLYVFPYLMLLREIYQHANAGTGDMNNTRVMHVDSFTRWALLAYGNDFHLIHHLYPTLPHDRLNEVHDVLLQQSADYAAAVEETFGVVKAPKGNLSILDMLAR